MGTCWGHLDMELAGMTMRPDLLGLGCDSRITLMNPRQLDMLSDPLRA